MSPPCGDNVCISPFGASFFLFFYETLPLGPLPQDPLLWLIPPATVTQPGAHETNLFSTDHEILSQNAEASRSQLVTPTTNAHLVAKEAGELLAGQSADQIQLWTNVTTQAQLEDYTIRSHLAADLIHIPAAPILETGLPASARNMDKILHDLQSQLIVAWRLVVQVLTHTLDFQPRKTFVDALNLSAWIQHLGERFTFVRNTIARGTANQTPELRRNTLKSAIAQTEQTNLIANQASFMPMTSMDLLTIGRNLQTQYNLTNTRQTPARHALTPAMILTRMLGRAPNVLLVNPIAADLIRPGLLNFPTQEEINAQHSIYPYQQQAGPFAIQQQGPPNVSRSVPVIDMSDAQFVIIFVCSVCAIVDSSVFRRNSGVQLAVPRASVQRAK
ncbi:MAG: hypothetical protein EZS28_039979, partial [Streblomastix strix]